MTSKERVRRAFGQSDGLPDRVPFQFDLCDKLIREFSRELSEDPGMVWSYYEDLSYRISANAIRTRLGSDCVVVGGSVAPGFTPAELGEGITVNEFGMHMKPTDLYVEVVQTPLDGIETENEVAAYDFPDPSAPGRFDGARRDLDRFGADWYAIGDVEISLFEFAWHLTGLEHYLVGMAGEEEWVEPLNDRVEEWTRGLALQLVELGVDAIWLGEDLGTQTSMLISPDQWRRMFKPRYTRMIAELKKKNPELVVIFHSDGAVAPLIHDWVEMGVDVYNPVQPNVPGSDAATLKAQHGNEIAFFGGLDQQQLLPSGDLQAIRAEMERLGTILGADGGYLMAPAHIIQADVTAETVRAMCAKALDPSIR
jgi:uroporphyrinogen decarboxylase